MTSDNFPIMIYSGSGVFGSVKNTVCNKDIVNQHHQQSSQRHGKSGLNILGIHCRLPVNFDLVAFVAYATLYKQC